MKALSKDDERSERFKKLVIRDGLLILVISMVCSLGIFFSLWMAAKGIID